MQIWSPAHLHTLKRCPCWATFPFGTPSYFPRAKYNFAFTLRTFIHVDCLLQDCGTRQLCFVSHKEKNRFRIFLVTCLKEKGCNDSSLTLCLDVTVKEFICASAYRSLETCVGRWHVLLHNMKLLTASPWQQRFQLLAELWVMAPPHCSEENTIWPSALAQQSFEINAACSTIYYPRTVQASESSVWNHTQRGITC